MTGSLVESIAGLLRRTYALEAPLFPIGRYVIGDDGLRRFYGEPVIAVGSEGGEGGRLLLRETEAGLKACIYFPDAMIRHLEAHPPQRGVREDNVDAFAVLVEEVDHLLIAAERAHSGRAVSLLEMETQANVSKELVVARFLAGPRRRLDAGRRLWLRHHLFHKRRYCDADLEVRARYQEASRLALGFLGRLERIAPARRVDALRGFHRAPLSRKVAMIAERGEAESA